MINYLTHRKFSNFNPDILPSMQGGGGGMSCKTYRVLEALREVYPGAKIAVNGSDVFADTLLIEPLRFMIPGEEGDDDTETLLETLKNYDGRKVLYCSEFTLLRMPPKLRNRLLGICDAVTANCRYLGRLFRYIGVNTNQILCDPVPEPLFVPDGGLKRRNRVIATGNVSWTKNTDGVIEVFKRLKGIVERVYIGSAKLWSNSNDVHAHRMEDALRANTDVFVEEATPKEVANHMKQCQQGFWCAYHDAFATAVHEMLMSGLVVVAAPHGLAKDIPVYVCDSICDQAETIRCLSAKIDPEKTSYVLESAGNTAWANDNVSYKAFNQQLRKVVGGI